MQSEPREFDETIVEALKSPVLYLRSEKQQMAIGSLAALLGLVQKTKIPKEHLPSVYKACEYVEMSVNILLDAGQFAQDLHRLAQETLENLRQRQ